KYRAALGAVLRPDSSSIGPYDRTHDRQPEAHALLLGREEWLEDSFQPLFRDPNSCIGNRYLDLGLTVERGLERESAVAWQAVQHGVNAVHRQIQYDLLQVHEIGAHDQRALLSTVGQCNTLAHGFRAKNVEHRPDRLIEVDILRLDRTLLQQSAQAPDN